MSDLYKRITTLCDNRKISAGQMCKDINLSRGIITDLKMGRKKNLSTDTFGNKLILTVKLFLRI